MSKNILIHGKRFNRFIDITGKKFNKLTVIKLIERNKYLEHIWLCKCDCGNYKKVATYDVKNGKTKSCGCLHHIAHYKTHGMSLSSEYTSWKNMRRRCFNKNNSMYSHYGARGITVCDRWKNSFENFYKDMGPMPKDYSIERKNVNKNYCPENCKWIPKNNQQRNTSRSIWLYYKREKMIMSEFANRIGIRFNVANKWFKEGLSPKQIAQRYGAY